MMEISTNDAVVIDFPIIIKAITNSNGERIIECEASCEQVDLEGDLILQDALLHSAPNFIKNGHIDLEHLSELGDQIGISDPLSYIIGKPLDVYDMGNGRTGVRAEIMRSKDGNFDPKANRYDAFWKSLQTEPAVQWRSSIYGFPTDYDNCQHTVCQSNAKRFVIKEMIWQSLAMTRSPMNDRITGYVHIVKAQDYIKLAKSRMNKGIVDLEVPLMNSIPQSMDDLHKEYVDHISKDCPYAGPGMISRNCFSDHFQKCTGIQKGMSDILGHAMMLYLLMHEQV